MKIHTKSALLACMFGLTGTAHAGAYIGLGVGTMKVDIPEFQDAQNSLVMLGYSSADDGRGAGFELHFTSTMNTPSVDFSQVGPNITGDYELKTTAFYLVSRGEGPLYLKGRIGYLKEEILVNASNAAFAIGASGSESGLSYGLGFGFAFSDRSGLEFDFSTVEKDVNFFSTNLRFSF